MRGILGLLLILAAPAAAQQSVSVSNTPSAMMNGTRSLPFADQEASQFRDNYFWSRERVDADNVRRAGAWGQCVVTAAPGDSRDWRASARTTALLRWSFDRCMRKVGYFTLFENGQMRRAALIDALRVTDPLSDRRR